MAVSGNPDSLDVIDRRRIVVTDPADPGANQPYHHALRVGLSAAEAYLARCASVAERLASAAIADVAHELEGRRYRIVGCALLLASGRPLPSLPQILASHALIHTAEGDFFRNAVRIACERQKISVTGTRERELDDQAKTAFRNATSRVQRKIASLGKSIGPPWTKDHKTAALAAAMILARAWRSSRRSQKP